MGKAIFKIALFFLLMLATILMLKISAGTVREKYSINDSGKKTPSADISYFFIGSSRVQQSIDPQIINKYYTNCNVLNLGISGGTLLSNCVIADLIIRRKGYKILFIELSPFLDELPTSLFNLSSETGFNPVASSFKLTMDQSFPDRSKLMLNIINQRIHNSITITEEVKKIFGYELNKDNEKWIGFNPSDRNDFHALSSFLKHEEIYNESYYPAELSRYKQIIDRLTDEAKNHHSKIVFFLPINYTKQTEKNIVIPLYNSLPPSMKLEFSDTFIRQISKAEYLMDRNHLNSKGATAYSRLLILELENYFNKNKEQLHQK